MQTYDGMRYFAIHPDRTKVGQVSYFGTYFFRSKFDVDNSVLNLSDLTFFKL